MFKRILCAFLCVALLFPLVRVIDVTYATEEATAVYCNWSVVSECRKSGKAPVPEGMEGRVFAGWYEDDACTDPLEFHKTAEGAYAKFVDAEVLTARAQLTKNTEAYWARTGLRLLTSVDSLNYESVGFRVEINGKVQTLISKTVYKTVSSYTKNNTEKYTADEVFSSESKYFMTVEIDRVPNSVFGETITVTPLWKTSDGIVVTGQTRTFTVYAGLDNKLAADKTTYGTVWSAPSTVKIGKTDAKNAIAVSGESALSYTAVCNEYESAQLILSANKAVQSYALYAGDLESNNGRILAQNIDVYVQKYIAYDDAYGTGSNPDPLLPMKTARAYNENSIASAQNGSLWVTVYIPKDTSAGIYTGSFQLVIEGATGTEVINIPVYLQVLDYTLPDTPSAKTLFSWRYDRVAPGELDGSLAMMEEYYEFFQDYRISLQSLPLGTLSGEEIKDALRKYGDKMSTFTLLKTVGDISNNFAVHTALFKEQILAIAEVSEPGNNYFEKTISYSVDEPQAHRVAERDALTAYYQARSATLEECIAEIEQDTTGRFASLKQIDASEWKASIRNIPDIPTMMAPQIKWFVDHKTEDSIIAFLQSINCICMIYSILEESYYNDFLSLCDTYDIDVWWYGSSGAVAPYPDYHIGDKNLLSARTVSWMQKKYDIKGNLYWDAAAYTDEANGTYNEYINVYETPYRSSEQTWPAGDGFLTYPGAPYGVYGPIPTVRLMSIRDGMEEYEILKDIEEYCNEGSFSGTVSVATAMDTIFYKTLYASAIKMNSDGANGLDFTQLREKLLSFAANMGKGLGYTMGEVSRLWSTNYFSCYAESGSTIEVSGASEAGSLYYTGDSYVTITVTNPSGQTASYRQYVGQSISSIAVTTQTSTKIHSTMSSAPKTEQTYNAQENSELLLSFDTYDNITGGSISVSKLLGETKVNTDVRYITEGNGSWMVRPEGDYGTGSGDLPWVRMRCSDTTFGTDDFSAYEKVLLDVYNASNEETSILIDFTAYAKEGTYLSAGERMFVLAPNTWTTCEYPLTDEMFSSYVDLTHPMKYMTLSFPDKKTGRTDSVPTLYIDNLRAVISSTPHQAMSYNFSTGVGFENAKEIGIFRTTQSKNYKVDKSSVAYANTNLAVSASQNGLGSYGMKADVTGSVWPEFRVRLDQTYAAGKEISFWLYAEADETQVGSKTYQVEAFNLLSGTAHVLQNETCAFNTWVRVRIQLTEATEYLRFFVNLDDRNLGTSILGNTPLTLYLDDFKVF